MLERFIRLMLSADLGDGGGGAAPDAGAEGATQTTGAAPDPAASSAAPASASSQPPGPDWSGLGGRYGGYEGVEKNLQYLDAINQRYQSDPAWAQKYAALWEEQKAPAAHPYDWMVGDDKRAEALRQQGEQHPDYPRLQAEFTNFFQNPIGHLANLVNHPKIAEALLPALLPQIQDLAQRIAQQQTAPLQQFVQHQGQQQFRQMYEKPWMGLPDHIKQAAQQNRFGDWNQNRNQCIINAIEFAKTMPQAAPAEGTAPAPPAKPSDKPKPGAPAPRAAANSSNARTTKAAEEFDREYTKAMGR